MIVYGYSINLASLWEPNVVPNSQLIFWGIPNKLPPRLIGEEIFLQKIVFTSEAAGNTRINRPFKGWEGKVKRDGATGILRQKRPGWFFFFCEWQLLRGDSWMSTVVLFNLGEKLGRAMLYSHLFCFSWCLPLERSRQSFGEPVGCPLSGPAKVGRTISSQFYADLVKDGWTGAQELAIRDLDADQHGLGVKNCLSAILLLISKIPVALSVNSDSDRSR